MTSHRSTTLQLDQTPASDPRWYTLTAEQQRRAVTLYWQAAGPPLRLVIDAILAADVDSDQDRE